MKMLMIAGAILALLGIAGLAAPVFQTHETKDVAKIGDLKLQTQQSEDHFIPPALAGGAVVLGAILLAGGLMRRRA